jgi:hypothetical protein
MLKCKLPEQFFSNTISNLKYGTHSDSNPKLLEKPFTDSERTIPQHCKKKQEV